MKLPTFYRASMRTMQEHVLVYSRDDCKSRCAASCSEYALPLEGEAPQSSLVIWITLHGHIGTMVYWLRFNKELFEEVAILMLICL